MIPALRQLSVALAVILLAGVALGSAIYSPVTSGGLPSITLTGDTIGVGAGGSIATTTSAINGVAYTAPLACATLTGTLGVDPQNTSTCASDSNTTIQTTCGAPGVGPVVHWRELVRRWGTTDPMLCANTTVVFLSSQSNATDPVVWNPYLNNNVSSVLEGTTPTTVATVSLSSVVAKSTTAGSNSLLQANLGASGAAGQFLRDTTNNSEAFVYKSLGSNNFSITQPLNTLAVPGSVFVPTENNAWANGDSVNLLTPITVNVAAYVPHPVYDDGTLTGSSYLYQLSVLAPTTRAPIALGTNVRVYDCKIARTINVSDAYAANTLQLAMWDDLLTGGLVDNGKNVNIWGGAVTSTGFFQFGSYDHGSGNIAQVNGDFIMGGGFTPAFSGVALIGGPMYLDANLTIEAGATVLTGTGLLYGNGTANVNAINNAHIANLTGASFTAIFTAPALISTGIQLNGASTGCSHTGAAPDVVNCNIPTIVANLDGTAGASGFGKNAYNPGGASVSNF